MERIRILFVCLGNICRSPLAEAIFRHQARARGVLERFEVDSAGTSAYHAGAGPDRRSVATARERGIEVTGTSRKISDRDLADFDLIVAMDAENLEEVEALRERVGGRARVRRLREWDPAAPDPDVPDPYFGGPSGFEDVHEIVERACERLLDDLLEGGRDGA